MNFAVVVVLQLQPLQLRWRNMTAAAVAVVVVVVAVEIAVVAVVEAAAVVFVVVVVAVAVVAAAFADRPLAWRWRLLPASSADWLLDSRSDWSTDLPVRRTEHHTAPSGPKGKSVIDVEFRFKGIRRFPCNQSKGSQLNHLLSKQSISR